MPSTAARSLLALQRTAGNRALTTLVQTNPATELAADRRAVAQLERELGADGAPLIDLARRAGVPGRDVLAAMRGGARGSGRADRVAAGTVYAVGRSHGSAVVELMISGQLGVRVRSPAELRAMAGARGLAVYVATSAAGAAAEPNTLHVAAGLSAADAGHRTIVVHELEHAAQDERCDHVTIGAAEVGAYRAQARAALAELRAADGTPGLATVQGQLVPMMSVPLLRAIAREGSADAERTRRLMGPVLRQQPAGWASPVSFDISLADARREGDDRAIGEAVREDYAGAQEPARFDGL